MSEVKIELMQFTNRPSGIEYCYRVYTESVTLAESITRNLKWEFGSPKYTRYCTGKESYLYISETLTTTSELQTIIDNFNKKPVVEVKLMEARFSAYGKDFFNYEIYTDLDTALRIKDKLSWAPAVLTSSFKPKTHTIGKRDHLAIYGCLNTPDELQQIVNNL
jgi:phosphoglucomutase